MKYASLILLTLATVASRPAKAQLATERMSGSYVVTVNDGYDTRACATKIDALPGITRVQALDATGVITFDAERAPRARLLALKCVGSLEADSEVRIPEDDDLMTGDYILVVGDGYDASTCAKQLKSAKGVSNIRVFNTIGSIAFKAKAASLATIKANPCVLAVEEEHISYPTPGVTGGN